jgi:hypothetical protein
MARLDARKSGSSAAISRIHHLGFGAMGVTGPPMGSAAGQGGSDPKSSLGWIAKDGGNLEDRYGSFADLTAGR